MGNHGVYIENTDAKITSSAGNVKVIGQGGGCNSSIGNTGIFLFKAGQITAGSLGTVEVKGTGGASSGGGNYGVYIFTLGSKITSSGGNVKVTGQGGGSGSAELILE
ncbi:MAG: hypothetical protein IPL23_13285 [Saprospiraceae bacterium]|nr:hypothetical protein [Saprospiraceae bacterium]